MNKETMEELMNTDVATASELADKAIEASGNVDADKVEEDIPQRILDMDWNAIRTYAKDLSVAIHGMDFNGVRKAVAEQEKINMKLLSGSIDGYAGVEMEDVKELTVQEKMERLVRVKVTNLNPNETFLTSTPITIANAKYRPATRIVKFGVITHVTAPMVEFLRNEKYAKSIPTRDANTGAIKAMRTVMDNHYNVLVLPPLTPKEIDALAKEQKATNRLQPLNE